MSQKETIEKAFGSIPKEIVPFFDLDWIPTFRGVKFYWYKLIRKVTR